MNIPNRIKTEAMMYKIVLLRGVYKHTTHKTLQLRCSELIETRSTPLTLK